MTIRTESSRTIAGSVPEVWAYVCDVGRWPEWAPTVREAWVRGGDPLQPGMLVEQRAKAWRQFHLREPAIDPGNGTEQVLLPDIDDLIPAMQGIRSQRGLEKRQSLFCLLRRTGSAPQQDQSEHTEDHQEDQHNQY